MSKTEARSVADKVAAALDVAYSMSNISGGPMWFIPQPPGKNKASIVLLAALDAQAAEIERLQQQVEAWQGHYNRLWEPARDMVDYCQDLPYVELGYNTEVLHQVVYPRYMGDGPAPKDNKDVMIERLQQQLDRSENTSHLLRTQLEGMRQELRDRDSECQEAKKELAEARQEAQEARKAAEWYSFMGPSIDEAQDALQSVYRFFRIATNTMNRDKEPKPETEPGNTFNDCTLIMSDCKEACGQCEALTREEQEQAASMEDACAKMYQRFINRQ